MAAPGSKGTGGLGARGTAALWAAALMGSTGSVPAPAGSLNPHQQTAAIAGSRQHPRPKVTRERLVPTGPFQGAGSRGGSAHAGQHQPSPGTGFVFAPGEGFQLGGEGR